MTARTLTAILAITLIAYSAAAEVVNIEWTVSNPLLTPENPTTTVTMTATWSPKYFFMATEFDVLGSHAEGGEISDIGCDVSEGHYEYGEITPDNNILGFVVWTWPPMFHGHGRKPLHVWFDYTATEFSPRQIEYASEHAGFALMTYEEWDYLEGDVEVSPISFQVIPAPGSVICFGVLALKRRR